MKPKPSSKKTIIVVVIAIIVLALVYFYFSSATPVADISTLETQSANADGARVLNLLNQIQSLHIDTKIFESPAYLSLVDYSVEIPEISVGRPNPFAPLSGVPTTPTGANSTP